MRSGGATAFFTQCESLVKTMTTGQEATAQASEMRLSTQQLVLFREAALVTFSKTYLKAVDRWPVVESVERLVHRSMGPKG